MKTLTEKQRQWLWFVGLWVGGISATLLLARVTRWLFSP